MADGDLEDRYFLGAPGTGKFSVSGVLREKSILFCNKLEITFVYIMKTKNAVLRRDRKKGNIRAYRKTWEFIFKYDLTQSYFVCRI